MKKTLFALAFTAYFAFGSSELEILEKECNDGDMESCLKAAFQYEDDDKKLKLVKKACDSGNKLGCLTTSGIMIQKTLKKT